MLLQGRENGHLTPKKGGAHTETGSVKVKLVLNETGVRTVAVVQKTRSIVVA